MTVAPPPYTPVPGSWDEMLDGAGAVRGEWEFLEQALREIGTEELLRRRQEAARLLEQDGVVYNVYDDGDDQAGWRLDPVPTVISSHEWAAIESGVIERAEVLSMILEDLYGARELLHRRLVPPELIFSADGFERACDGIAVPGRPPLFTYAVDIGRDEDGRAMVIGDRTQAPSGAGYALQNRTVIQRVIPSLYRDSHVHRLAPFFRALRLGLKEIAPARASDDPRIVVLTPGPRNETAFEHAVLASTLGFPLVEGRDLLVRGRRVHMRSVGRLEPVHVILRRVDSEWCDPLELRPDSQLGVPGLLEAVRSGNVAVANPLGSSVLESPALMVFLPRLAEHLLGRPLALPSAPAWWCGEEESRRYVLAHLRELVLRPTSRTVGEPIRRGWELSSAQLRRAKRLIEADPHRWVAQQPPALASTPTLTGRGLEARRSVLRTFAVARGDSYVVMPGGLTRVAPDPAMRRVTNQAGALSKDTWVLSSEPEPLAGTWLQPGPAVEGIDPMSSIPSRAAENLWWLGRYAERAEAITRLLRTVLDRRNEFEGAVNPAGTVTLRALLVALTETTGAYPGFTAPDWADGTGPIGSSTAELASLIGDSGRVGTLAHAVRAMLDCAYAVRDQLSGDTWLIVGPLERAIAELDPAGGESGAGPEPRTVAQSALQEVMRSLMGLAGLGVESMVRDIGWRFMDAGRRLERSLQLLSLLRHTVTTGRGEAADSMMLESVLTTAESIITYRLRYRARAQLETVLELLLLDPGNPRSLAYQLERLAADLEVLPHGRELRLSAERRLVLAAQTELQLADLAALTRPPEGADLRRHVALPVLSGFLLDLHGRLTEAGEAVDRHHFIHVTPTYSLVGPAGAEPSIGRAA